MYEEKHQWYKTDEKLKVQGNMFDVKDYISVK